MPAIIRAYDNRNKPIIDGRNRLLKRTYFNLLRLKKGETTEQKIPGFETVYVVLSGSVDIVAAGERFASVGKRKNVWAGKADSVYAPVGAEVRLTCRTAAAEIAVAGGRYDKVFQPFRIKPEDEIEVEVGSKEAHCRRRIQHILGKNAEGRNGNLLVSELYADSGSWSGYPPHKHDTDDGKKETAFEEAYYFKFNPENGFGAELVFQPNGKESLFLTRNGDTVLIDKGYHPTVTSPGHEEYIFTILVGKTTRSLVQNFKDEYRYLTKVIPGVKDMVDNFK